MMLLKWLRGIVIAIIVLILIALFFLYTTPGLKSVFYVASKFIPGQLTYQNLDGDLMGTIHAKEINYVNNGSQIGVENLHFNWSPGALFHKKLVINSLLIDSVTIIMPETKPVATPQEKITNVSIKQQVIDYLNNLKKIKLKPLSLPLSINIKMLHIGTVNFGHSDKNYLYSVQDINVHGQITAPHMNLLMTAGLIKPQKIQVTMMLNGSITDYTATLTAKNKQYDFIARVKGNQDAAVITIPKAHALSGEISGVIALTWYPHVNWDIDLDITKIDLQVFDKSLPNSVSMLLKTKGKLADNDLLFDLKTNIKVDQASIKLYAEHQKIWNAKWDINVPNIAALYPKAKGALMLKGTLHGKLTALETRGKLQAEKLHYNDIKIAGVKGQWQLYFDKSRQSSLQIALDNIEHNQNNLSKVNLNLNGNLVKHNVNLKLSVGEPALVFATRLHYSDKNIKGTITQFNSSFKKIGDITLRKPANFAYSEDNAYLKPMCLDVSIGGYACVKAAWQKDKPWNVDLQSHDFDFKGLLNKFLSSITFNGKLSINAHAEGIGKEISNASVKAVISPGILTSRVDNNVINMAVRRSTLNVAINSKVGLKLNTDFNFARRGSFKVKAHIPDFIDSSIPFSDKTLQSTISVVVHDFSFVSIFEHSVQVSNGTFAGTFTANGTLGNPKIKGDGTLKIPLFVYTLVNVKAHNITAHLHVDGKKLTYNLIGYAYNKAPLYFSGDTVLSSPYALTHFYVHAKNAEAIKTNQMDAYVNTELRFLLTHSQLDIVGYIQVPKAKLAVISFGGVTLMPVNQVTYTGLPKSFVAETSRKKVLNLKLGLGNDVSFSGYGAHASLKGLMVLSILPTKGTVANGQVRIVKGDFKAYGQDLEIADGSSVSFHNSQVTNPYINAYAYKYVTTTMESTGMQLADNILKVGLQIHGTINDMKFNLYSQPPGLSQADILSYLVLGVAADNNNAASLSVLFNTAGGIARGDISSGDKVNLTGIKKFLNNTSIRMRNETVLDVIGNPVQDQASFVVGNQLSNSFYVQYSQGLIIPESIFSAKYRFNKNWAIQSQAGSGYNVGVGADILYSFER